MTLPQLVPNLHPFMVHFSVALLLVSTAFLLVGRACAAQPWGAGLLHAGRWNLYLAASFALVSIGTGWFAFLDTRVDSQALATVILHRRTGAIAWWLSLFAAVAVWRTRERAPGWVVLLVLVIASCSITASALYGTQLVYGHGLGIERKREEPRMPVARSVLPPEQTRACVPTACVPTARIPPARAARGAEPHKTRPAVARVREAGPGASPTPQKRNNAPSDRNHTSSIPSMS